MKALIINGNGHSLRVVPVFDWFSPNVLHWVESAHPRHTVGFYSGVPWRAATRINVFCRGEARLAPTIALLARIRNATLFFALKVQYNLAQGSALGYDTPRPMRPVVATH